MSVMLKKTKGGENIRKQVILLVTTIVFALLLSGAVSAEDSQGVDVGNNTLNSSDYNGDALVDPEITLNVTLEHPEALSENRLPTVNVTDNNGNAIPGVTVTSNGNGIYKVNFLSDGTNFNLDVSAWGHVAQSVNVQCNRQ